MRYGRSPGRPYGPTGRWVWEGAACSTYVAPTRSRGIAVQGCCQRVGAEMPACCNRTISFRESLNIYADYVVACAATTTSHAPLSWGGQKEWGMADSGRKNNNGNPLGCMRHCCLALLHRPGSPLLANTANLALLAGMMWDLDFQAIECNFTLSLLLPSPPFPLPLFGNGPPS